MTDRRRKVWERDGGPCQLCQSPVPFDRTMEIDHIQPRSAGGNDALDNVRTAHRRCNRERFTGGYETLREARERLRLEAIRKEAAEHPLLKIQQVAERLNLSRETVRRWLRMGRIAGIKFGATRGGYRVMESEVERVLREGVQ